MTLQSGTTILNNYRIEKSIGQGAFGEVFLATHTGLNGKRAVKVLLRDTIGLGSTEYDEYRNRFRQESQLMEWFNHPNIIRIYDFQEVDKTLYLIMEYAAGGSLKQKLDDQQTTGIHFTPDETIRIAVDIAEGLGLLHEKDVVHRDLKPSNILFNEKGKAKLADFGLAQIPGGASMRSQMSLLKPHPGTPAYMSPEQEVTGSYLRPASDIYSLGLILFEMLTGRSYKNIKPGTGVKSLAPETPGWFNDLLGRMLAESHKDRPWDGSELINLLRSGQSSYPLKDKTDGNLIDKADVSTGETNQNHLQVESESNIHKVEVENIRQIKSNGGSQELDKPVILTSKDSEIQEYLQHGLLAVRLGNFQSADYFANFLNDMGAIDQANTIRTIAQKRKDSSKLFPRILAIIAVVTFIIIWLTSS